MTFIQYILEDDILCPRCNANSQIRAEDKNDMVFVYHVCPYCKLHKYIRTTTRRAMKLEKREKHYIELLNKANNIGEKRKILGRIDRLRKQINILELGIGGKSRHGRTK